MMCFKVCIIYWNLEIFNLRLTTKNLFSFVKFLIPLAVISLSQASPFPHEHGYSYVTKHDGHYGGHGSGEGDGNYQAYSTGHLGGNGGYDSGYEGDGDSHEDYYVINRWFIKFNLILNLNYFFLLASPEIYFRVWC